MRLGIVGLDLRMLVGLVLSVLLVACDSDGTVVTTAGGTTPTVNDPEVVVVGDPTDPGIDPGTDNPNPECIDTAPIGDGWGWDGSSSCRVGESDAGTDPGETVNPQEDPVTQEGGQECIDTPPVGDGWGWNGTESCRIGDTTTGGTPVIDNGSPGNDTGGSTAPVGSVTDLVLVTGQSNALGAGTGYDEFLDSSNQEVMAFTNEGWRVADLNQVWDRNWFPRNDPNTPPSNNFSLHFGKRVADRTTGRVVGFILLTSPGSAISDWRADGELFNQIRIKVSQAINELPFKSQLDGILWHQGESDGEDRDEYSAALYDLITRFRSEPWFSDGRPFICGETASSPVNNQLNRLNTDADPWTSCIAAEGLPVIPNTDHFNASSLRTMGQRYADEYMRMWLGIE